MKRIRKLGQHILTDEDVLDRIVGYGDVTRKDVVFEIGTGNGNLTERLCQRARRVISCEIDLELYRSAKRRLSNFKNLRLICGDGFDLRPRFSIFISNLPYSESSRFVEWLMHQRFRRAVVMVQKEFASKLLAKPRSRQYRALTVLAQSRMNASRMEDVGNRFFEPRPKVSSTILVLKPKARCKIDDSTAAWVKTLFTFRGRRLSAGLKTVAKQQAIDKFKLLNCFDADLERKRIEELDVNQVIYVARRLAGLTLEECRT